jgi:hypothetical protein
VDKNAFSSIRTCPNALCTVSFPEEESVSEDYRANLEVCRRMAERAPNGVEKRAWLDMAESWRVLLIAHQQSSTDQNLDPPPSGDRAIRILSQCLWPMLQAGGYVLEYRAIIREKAASFSRSLPHARP